MPARGRVLIVAPQPFYEDRGTPIAVRQVIDALLELGYAVDLLTFPVGSHLDRPGLRIFRAANPFGIARVPIGFSMRKLALDVSLVHALRRLLDENEYCRIHAVEEAAFPAVYEGGRRGIPVIYDMQSSLPEQLRVHRLFRVAPVHALARRAERWLLRRADIVVSSAGLAERVRQLAPETPCREWHYASPLLPATHDAGVQLRRSLGIALDAPVALYSGTFETYQGLGDLIAAMPRVLAEMPRAVFVLVGARDGDAEAIRRLAGRVVPAASLRIVTRQPREEMPRYLAMADVLVSPRKHGGNLPLKIFDYLGAGRPIVATDIDTHRGVLNEECALLVESSASGLARGIALVLCDSRRASTLAGGARRYADRYLAWQDFVVRVGEVYDGVRQRA